MTGEDEAVEAAVSAARAAQAEAASWTQRRADEVTAAVGWHLYQETTARRLALRTVVETGLGDHEDLVAVHRRRVLGVLDDMCGAATVGVVAEEPERGLRRVVRPLGVIAVATPATAPAPAVAGNALPILKTRNAAVFTANPRALRSAAETVAVIRDALAEVGAPVNLMQCLPMTSRAVGTALMRACDSVVAIGGAGIAGRANESGTPAVAAGVGNPTVIVDETADLADAVAKIHFGARFNHGISCSSESNVLVHDSIAREFEDRLAGLGAHLCAEPEAAALRDLLRPDGVRLNRDVIGKPAAVLAGLAGIGARSATLLVLRCADPWQDGPVLHEKLAPVLTLVRYRDFAEAVEITATLLDRCGRGHSCGVHTTWPDRAALLAERVPTCRVVVNQTTTTNTGSFDSGVPFTATLAAGSWGGSSVSGNLTWRHFLNHTTVSYPIRRSMPDEAEIFGPYLSRTHARGQAR